MSNTITRQIAVHEAGHAVAAHALGLRGLTIVRTDNGFACGMEAPAEPSPTEQWVMAIVTAAGAGAEVACGYDPGEGGDEDWSLVIEHVCAWAGISEPPEDDGQFDANLRTVCDTAFAITRHRTGAIFDLADAIMRAGGNLDAAQVAECIALAEGQ